MKRILTVSLPITALLLITALSTPVSAQYRRGRQVRPAAGRVIINGKPLARSIRLALVRRGVRIRSGRYWYDRRTGAWGFKGGPTRGIITPGLRIGGRLKANASRGRSGVYINGRQIKYSEARYLRRLVRRLPRGRYWVDRWGNAGRVGGPALVNLRRLAAARSARYNRSGRRGGNRNWLIRGGKHGGRSGISLAGDGKTTCVSTKGYTRCY